MKKFVVLCLLSVLALPACASVRACEKGGALQTLHDPRLQTYFSAHISLERELGV